MDSQSPMNRRAGVVPDSPSPRVWVLLDDRPGNSTQSLGLAEALGWPYEIRELEFGPLSKLHNRWLGASARSLNADAAQSLTPPWPDLVIAAGRRSAPVALFIREQSGGHTCLVQLGRKGGDVASLFDLVVTPRYTRQLASPNRVETLGPLHRITEEKLEEAGEEWRTRLTQHTRSPRIAVLVGGTSGQYRLDAETARRLGAEVEALARETGGSLLVSVSRRTAEDAADALASEVGAGHYFHRWRPDGDENPYLGFLALADAFVITGDSESMVAEACATKKPVYIVSLPRRLSWSGLRFNRELVVGLASSYRSGTRSWVPGVNAIRRVCAWLQDRGYVRPARDLDLMHADLIHRGWAHRFGEPFSLESVTHASDDVDEVVRRVREIMAS